MRDRNKITIILFLLLLSSYFFYLKKSKKTSSIVECIDTFQRCESIYQLDSTFVDLPSNLLYARWQIREGNIINAITILDRLEAIQSKIKKDKLYQEIVLFQFLAKHHDYKLDLESINKQLDLNLSDTHNINMLYFKSQVIINKQEINYAYATSLYAEYLRSKISPSEEKDIYYLPWSIHSINLIREQSDSLTCKSYLNKTLENCMVKTPGCRWIQTLLFTLDENLSKEKIKSIKNIVIQGDQYSPLTDNKIITHLNFVCTDQNFVIQDLLSQIDTLKPLNTPSNFYNIIYLIEAYLDVGNLIEAESWLDKIFKTGLKKRSFYNFALIQKQKLLFKQYKQLKTKEKLLEIFKCSNELTHSYTIEGESIINEHYASSIFTSNNMFLEALYELYAMNNISSVKTLNIINSTKSLYNKISDSRSVLGSKIPTGKVLKRINFLKHEIEKRELTANRYQDTNYHDLSIFEELYFLHQELYDIKQNLQEINRTKNELESINLNLSNINRQTQILDYIQTDSSIFLSRITSDYLELKKLDYTKTLNAIEEKKERLLDSDKSNYNNYLDSVIVDLVSTKHPNIIFIPDGKLFEFPIESIKNEEGKYLIDNYTISYASQISEAIDNPELKIKDELFAASYTSDNTIKDRSERSHYELSFGQHEVDEIEKLYRNTSRFEGYKFTEESLAYALEKDIVHISSHSSSSTENPLDNYIVVRNQDGQGVPVYGFTLKSMDWDTKMVILSSCDSGTGTIKPGAGIFSLSRDFLQTGAETVIKSLWKVNDKSTSELMIAFHENLKNGLSASKALQLAKQKVKEQSEFSHPYYWSGFVLEGNPNLLLIDR